MSFRLELTMHVYAQRNLRFHPAYETPRDKQRVQRDRDELVADNARLVELNRRLRNARVLEAVA